MKRQHTGSVGGKVRIDSNIDFFLFFTCCLGDANVPVEHGTLTLSSCHVSCHPELCHGAWWPRFWLVLLQFFTTVHAFADDLIDDWCS